MILLGALAFGLIMFPLLSASGWAKERRRAKELGRKPPAMPWALHAVISAVALYIVLTIMIALGVFH